MDDLLWDTMLGIFDGIPEGTLDPSEESSLSDNNVVPGESSDRSIATVSSSASTSQGTLLPEVTQKHLAISDGTVFSVGVLRAKKETDVEQKAARRKEIQKRYREKRKREIMELKQNLCAKETDIKLRQETADNLAAEIESLRGRSSTTAAHSGSAAGSHTDDVDVLRKNFVSTLSTAVDAYRRGEGLQKYATPLVRALFSICPVGGQVTSLEMSLSAEKDISEYLGGAADPSVHIQVARELREYSDLTDEQLAVIARHRADLIAKLSRELNTRRTLTASLAQLTYYTGTEDDLNGGINRDMVSIDSILSALRSNLRDELEVRRLFMISFCSTLNPEQVARTFVISAPAVPNFSRIALALETLYPLNATSQSSPATDDTVPKRSRTEK